MKTVAKLVIKHGEDFLMMHRCDHPTFGVDPDLPGGTAEKNESTLQTILREVGEETGVLIKASQVNEIYSGNNYSRNGTYYSLFITEVPAKPRIIMSWEHSSYEWIDKSRFIKKALRAKDTYMHMVGETLKSYNS